MKKLSPLVPLVVAGSLGASFCAMALSCGSYSSQQPAVAGAAAIAGSGNGPATGGSGNSAGSGGSDSTCAAGTVQCAAACVDSSTDNANCGFCGNACTSDQVCQDSLCACAAGNATCVPAVKGICDFLAGAGHPCVSAHSTVRNLLSSYTGPLYQVCKGAFVPGPDSCASGMSQDIGTLPDGSADGAAQDTFCTGGTCTISIIYDQSPMKNDLKPGPRGGQKATPDNPVKATDLKTTINGKLAYGVLIKPGSGYRILKGNGTATGDQAQSMYMVSSQQNLINGCCFDYGNAETSANDDGNGTMEAVYLGQGVVWGSGVNGGPWVMADLENGLYAGWENKQDAKISTNTPLKHDFVTAVVVGDVMTANAGKGRFALYGGDATVGVLKTMYDGIRPEKAGYVPMQKQGSIILGSGGDNSSSAGGRFYEGVITMGAWSKATVDGLQARIVTAKYGK
ncbi:MAG: arabinofuranosidase catalytic domain-containing protein [Polyangiaceae bacterium]